MRPRGRGLRMKSFGVNKAAVSSFLCLQTYAISCFRAGFHDIFEVPALKTWADLGDERPLGCTTTWVSHFATDQSPTEDEHGKVEPLAKEGSTSKDFTSQVFEVEGREPFFVKQHNIYRNTHSLYKSTYYMYQYLRFEVTCMYYALGSHQSMTCGYFVKKMCRDSSTEDVSGGVWGL